MAVYAIFEAEIHDHEAYERYKAAVRPMIEAAGGEYLVRGGAVDVVAGDWRPGRVVMFRWPDRATMDAFMDGAAYRPWRELREGASTLKSLVILEGIADGG